ncbi:ComEC/Rec2 family competence protein [Dyadobacter psychrotolerans]|uniref:ComEC family competence protein n=1 Tax=Dyadobacter psychrotolerans TaxID=2541721 RepID=A0A4R5E168_9BACT|nr:ComEC/Rec2 family competence protein [Dyadobacter psychrotolerans]TDE17665.1 ComEC family competence protein [Dyadobacter psychrotolerans]
MFSRTPYLGFVIFFITGILLDTYLLSQTGISNTVIIGISLSSAALSFWFFQIRSYRFTTFCLSVCLISAGAVTHLLQLNQLNTSLTALSDSTYTSYQTVVRSLPEKRAKSIRMEVLIQAIRKKAGWKSESTRALLSIPSDAAVVPKPGDFIVVRGKLGRPDLPLNPEEFDYQTYLWNKGIVWTGYLPEGSYQILPDHQASGPAFWSMKLSEWADRTFRENIKDDKSYGLVKAMLLGRRDDLRSDQVDDYTTSGTVHSLSVSGMHVAIIFLVISTCLNWLKRWNPGRYIYLLLVTALLCFYALVTGIPPSVQRATLMCIVFVIAEVFKRKQASINTLSISALLILIFDANAIYDVGFQLSYLAMTGIFLLYQPIERFWKPSNHLSKYIWQITALSFAAQLATFPLSLYYFHQFPSYFWLINPFVIGFTNVLLPAAMVLLLFSLLNITWLQAVVNWTVDISAYLTNVSVSVPKLLPGYLVENLYLDKFEVVLLYGCIVLVWLSYSKQENIWLKYCSAATLVFIFYSVSLSFQKYVTPAAMIHSVPKHSVISFKEGNRLYISSDPAFIQDSDAYDFRIKNYAISEGVLERIFIPNTYKNTSGKLTVKNWDDGRLIAWQDKIITHGNYVNTSQSVDYMLITSGKPGKMPTMKSNTIFLTGGEIHGRRQAQWQRYFGKNTFYDLSSGALSLH